MSEKSVQTPVILHTHALHSVKVGQGLFPRRSWVAACYGKKMGVSRGWMLELILDCIVTMARERK